MDNSLRFAVLSQVYYLLVIFQHLQTKCICECNQSRHRVVFYPEPLAVSTTFCGWRCLLQPERVVESDSLGPSQSSSQKLRQSPPEQVVHTDSELVNIVLYHSLIKDK